MLYQISNGTKYFGVNDVFSNIDFSINENEKIAIIGRNGCGKSTLLKIIMKLEELSSGNIYKPNNLRIGYLSQKAFVDDNLTLQQALDNSLEHVLDIKNQIDDISLMMQHDHSDKLLEKYSRLTAEFDAIGGYNYQNELETLLTKFGFSVSDLVRPISTFSGGQKTRLAFITLLISKPDILLLDEPTNHLDLKTIEWLEGYLKRYPSAIVLVSHDRYFLDNIVSIVYELEYGTITKYNGNYTYYQNKKRLDLEKNHQAYYRQQKEIERMEALIEKFRYKKNKAAFAQSKIKQLDRMEKIVDKSSDTKTFKANFTSKIKGGNDVLFIEDLVIGYDKPLCDITFNLYRNNRVCIIGDNGTGKSTLLKTLIGEIKPISGNYLFGHQIEIGYFDQNHLIFNDNKTVLEEVWDDYPHLEQTNIRTILGNFLFSADDVFKLTNVLSGGEKVRLALVKLVLQRPNLLILDEPTNHLDILGKQALEQSLKEYDGTILMVSHDRYFIKEVANSILAIDNLKTNYYEYGYSDYLESKKNTITKIESTTNTIKKDKSKVSNSKLKILEDKINNVEQLINDKKQLGFTEEYCNSHIKLEQLEIEIEILNTELEELMEKWEEFIS